MKDVPENVRTQVYTLMQYLEDHTDQSDRLWSLADTGSHKPCLWVEETCKI